MDFKKMGDEIVDKAIKWGAGEAEACLENVRSFEVNVRKGEIETLHRSVSRGLGLRVFIDKQLGFAYTSDLSAGAVDETIKKAIELARITEPKPWQGLPDFGPQSPADLDLYDSGLASVADDRKIVLAREVEKIALAEDKRKVAPYLHVFKSDAFHAWLADQPTEGTKPLPDKDLHGLMKKGMTIAAVELILRRGREAL